ncbi:MAG: UDP-N-acetylmuramoyl-L-alanine--D-glutamate ligase [Alphaproteobacteria bacterium]|jgi:UDP-N-acetylmuramoylalanine--D-glutamate ligase|nr:UDP-N-acetylmuramoyl-L-alanine--D-glutamate ligase [Alphaproteobacteria bacterium]MDP6566348.1 UDP-N-acetylmuramoyl-L-alanine--D-glutamate ligase [Alphaproteobacteria bacterium]MDP6812508.1 UDP-N-acetylmuramoyl-L-alanine--D-glutamate ligase [Alphaproteobacteria bacterium]
MIPIEAYRDRTVAVFGLGRTGLSAARALLAGGARVLVWDDDPNRRQAAQAVGAQAVEPGIDGWAGIAALVLSPGVPLTHPAPHMVVQLADRLGAEVLGDVELFARTRPSAAIAAVTGTNGKSTATSLIGHLLAAAGRQVQVGANLGQPVLDFQALPADGVYVLEMSSYQIDLCSGLRPRVAALTNISPDHLDRHGGMDGYVAAKRRLLEMACADATLVIGSDDEWSAGVAEAMRRDHRRVVEVAVNRRVDNGIFARDGVLYRAAGCAKVRVADLRGIDSLRGSHNWQNAAVAFAVAEALGLPGERIAKTLRGYPGLPHRLEAVGRLGAVSFVNDSKATNAEATSHALATFDDIYWIAGGIAKQGGIEPLAGYFPKVAKAFLIGEAAPAFARSLSDRLAHEVVGDLDAAVQAAHAAAQAAGGGVVLLSPACASFDQFDSFEARGDAFRGLVHEIVGNGNSNGPRRAAGGAW